MKNDKAWFNVGAKCNRRMKEAARNAHMVLKGIGVVERGTCTVDGKAFADSISGTALLAALKRQGKGGK